jgi:hypothetical protein
MLECCQEPLKIADGAIDATVLRYLCQWKEGFREDQIAIEGGDRRSVAMAEFDRGVKPIDDVDCRPWHRVRQPS